MLVQVSAPGHQTRPQGTSAPNRSRPRATGRLYSIVITVSATCWLTVPCWLGRGLPDTRKACIAETRVWNRRATPDGNGGYRSEAANTPPAMTAICITRIGPSPYQRDYWA